MFLHVQIDWRLLAFTTIVTVAAALLVGLAPALRAARADPIDAIRERGRGVTVDRRFGLASALVIGQVSLSVVLVFGAGLFVRTFTSLKTLDLGFDRDPVLVVRLDAQGSAVEPAHRAAHFERVLEAVRGVPGVAHAALSSITPVSGSVTDFGIQVEHGRPATDLTLVTPGRLPRDGAYINALTPDWFATYGTRLIDGRDFEPRDRTGAPPVAIVNETFVRRLMPEGRPIGRRFRGAFSQPGRPNPWIEVVGVAADSTYSRLRDELPPTFYVPIAQWLDAPTSEVPATMRLSLRASSGAPALLTPRVADVIAGVDPAMGVTFMPLAQQINDTLVRERILAMLSGFFGVLALLLAGLGLYGLMSYSVSRRRHEIGIRIALGAEAGHVLRMVLGRVLAARRRGDRRRRVGGALGVALRRGAPLWRGEQRSRHAHHGGARPCARWRRGRLDPGSPRLAARPRARAQRGVNGGLVVGSDEKATCGSAEFRPSDRVHLRRLPWRRELATIHAQKRALDREPALDEHGAPRPLVVRRVEEERAIADARARHASSSRPAISALSGNQRTEVFAQASVAAEQIPFQSTVVFCDPRVLRRLVGQSFEQADARCAERAHVHLVNGRPVGAREWSRTSTAWLARRRLASRNQPGEAVLARRTRASGRAARRPALHRAARHDRFWHQREASFEQQRPDAFVPRGRIDEHHRDPRERAVRQRRDRSNHDAVLHGDQRAVRSGRQEVLPVARRSDSNGWRGRD